MTATTPPTELMGLGLELDDLPSVALLVATTEVHSSNRKTLVQSWGID